MAVATTTLGGLWWGRVGLLSAAAGAALACGNLWVMRRLLDRALAEASGGGAGDATRRLLGGLALKTPIFLALIYVAIVHLALDPTAFVLGLSTLILALVFGGLYVARRDG